MLDATRLERSLNLVFQIMEITPKIIVCVNLLDEAKKKNIKINLPKLSKLLGVPVIGTIAHKKKTLTTLVDTIYKVCKGEITPNPQKAIYPDFVQNHGSILDILFASFDNNLSDDNHSVNSEELRDAIVSSIVHKSEAICKQVCSVENNKYSNRDRKLDKLLTSKAFGIPIMILFLMLIFWITIVGANYPSDVLFAFFGWIQEKLIAFATYISCPQWLSDMLILGVYQTLTWVISVMLPPMAIFFPLFTILEDLGYLPRIAFNMDGFFKKACCSRKADDNYVYGLWL